MLKRYGEEAVLEGDKHAHELAEDGDRNGAATWLRITNAIAQLANTTPPGTVKGGPSKRHQSDSR
jgi:hypothetical protein